MDHTYVNPQLSLFSYEVLGLVGPNGAGAHDLLRMARHGRILDWAGESQYYVEPKRLAKLGYLAARTEPGKTRQRTVYTLTDKGRQALSEWARTPVRFTPVKSELLLRLLIADLVGEATTRDSITTVRDDISDLFARLGESEAFAATRPSRTKYLLLVFGFLRRLLELHLEFVDDLERELTPGQEPAEPPGLTADPSGDLFPGLIALLVPLWLSSCSAVPLANLGTLLGIPCSAEGSA